MNEYSFRVDKMKKNNGLKKQVDKREKILYAAVRVFAKNGFYNSTISQIAKEAGVADGTIYIYFKNKDDILIKVFEEAMSVILTTLNEKMKEVDDPVEKLRIYIENQFELATNYPDLAEVIQVELRQSAKFMKEYTNEPFRKYLNIIKDIINEGKEKGIFREDVDAGLMKRVIFGTLDEITLHWVLKGKKYDLAPVVDKLHKIFLEGILKKH